MLEARFWLDRRVLVTGHTGFKGAWLSAWLSQLGARLSGLALAPDQPRNLHDLLRTEFAHTRLGDIRDAAVVRGFLDKVQPEIVLHLAAQAIVRRSYGDPIETFATNVMGTVNLLEAARHTPSVRAVLVVTTDKVYENAEGGQAFAESDRLGGHDPYSASKACAELVTSSYRRSFFNVERNVVAATARSGNVIGGGDWSLDRVVPDIVRALEGRVAVRLRYPGAVRPWLHVLEPLAGYLMMCQDMISRPQLGLDTLNFAPAPGNMRTVSELVDSFTAAFGGRPGWTQESGNHPREAQILRLSAEAAQARIGWQPRLSFADTVAWTAEWHRAHRDGQDVRRLTNRQIRDYGERLTLSEQAGLGAVLENSVL